MRFVVVIVISILASLFSEHSVYAIIIANGNDNKNPPSTYVDFVTVVVVVVVLLGYPRPNVMYDFCTSVNDVVTLALTTQE